MDGIIIIDKPKGYTSRDVVNVISKKFNTKKVGHTGTLDPLATGVLVVALGKATKLVDEITCYDKEYIASVKIGILTDTLDVTGKIIEAKKCVVKKEDLVKTINSFLGFYDQTVPIYSAVKVGGKKLYNYARENKDFSLPKRKVEVKKIELLEFNSETYKFKVSVSKGTYIRSLIKDINDKLGIIGVMTDLRRTKQGSFNIKDAYTLDDIENNNYNLLSINDVLTDIKKVVIDDTLYKKIKNGSLINNCYNIDKIAFIYNDDLVAIYKTYEKDKKLMKPCKMFI